MLYFFGFLFLFVFGGMTGVAVATQSLDVHWHDTYFVVAHFHFIMVGGTRHRVPRRGALLVPEDVRPALLRAVRAARRRAAVFIGFCLTFLPQFLLGNMGMPRRYYSYPAALSVAARAFDGRRVSARRRRSCWRSAICCRRSSGARRRRPIRGIRAATSG